MQGQFDKCNFNEISFFTLINSDSLLQIINHTCYINVQLVKFIYNVNVHERNSMTNYEQRVLTICGTKPTIEMKYHDTSRKLKC